MSISKKPIIDLIIPALNEEYTIPLVLRDVPKKLLREIIVVDNGSTDGTARIARACGATVLSEPRRGYGAACQKGIEYISMLSPPPDIVVFLDADYSDDPTELPMLLSPIRHGGYDLIIGSRVLGDNEPGSLQPQQMVGNAVAVSLIRAIYGYRYTDLGPFRAIRYPALIALGMKDADYGWTIEMQVKALKIGLRVAEVPVRYRKRAAGTSKVSGTVRGSLGAGYKILFTVFRHATAR